MGREGWGEGRMGGEGREGWMTVIHILIGMFNLFLYHHHH